ncbi:hypothetical protein [Actinoplanes sp. OR16]|uniref:hypothetical protein n=1 Tax=Actinoplanes sp. OR16 TaxID=946334 RepID=UPI00135F189E|nr:hypothetical protein [Actinoplanes sp. OR16]
MLDLILQLVGGRGLPQHHPDRQEVGGRQPGGEDLGQHRFAGARLAEDQQRRTDRLRAGEVPDQERLQVVPHAELRPPRLVADPGGRRHVRDPEPGRQIGVAEPGRLDAVRRVGDPLPQGGAVGPGQRLPPIVRGAAGGDVPELFSQAGEGGPGRPVLLLTRPAGHLREVGDQLPE